MLVQFSDGPPLIWIFRVLNWLYQYCLPKGNIAKGERERERERERETNIYFQLIVLRIHRVTRVILSLLSFVISINKKQIVEIWESSIAVRWCIGMYLQKLSISCWDQKEYLCKENSEENITLHISILDIIFSTYHLLHFIPSKTTLVKKSFHIIEPLPQIHKTTF